MAAGARVVALEPQPLCMALLRRWYGKRAGVVLLESMGIPLPGETVIMAAAVLSAANLVDASPLGIAIAGSIGAIAT